ncbi:MAG: DUF929 family protein [Nitrososphaerales archaeon]|jgi:hypothetical protein
MGRRASINAKKRNRRIVTISIVVVIIAAVVILAFIVQSANNCPNCSYIGKPVSDSVVSALKGVSDQTLNTIGVPSGVIPPNKITGQTLTSGGKPEVFYLGGDYCPYCAVERWSLLIALSHFGNFSGLQYMVSSSTDVNSNTPTFTFSNGTGFTYSSNYITFVPVEEFDRSGNQVVTLTAAQTNLVTLYDTCPSTGTNGGIPFVDIDNTYAVSCGAQSSISLSGGNWTAIASQLDNTGSTTAQQLDGAASTLITAICNVDGGLPTSVCTQSYATITLAYTSGGAAAGAQSLTLASQVREEPRWTSSTKPS